MALVQKSGKVIKTTKKFDLKESNFNSESQVEKIQYNSLGDVYFAFIDVLGFKQDYSQNKHSQPDGKYADIFYTYAKLIANFSDRWKDAQSTFYAGQTSDSLYFYSNRIECLVEFLILYSKFSLYSMLKSVFFRGGIAKGTLSCNHEYQFYGDAVIGAYLLESDVAKYPILALDLKTYNDVNKYCKDNDMNDFVCKEDSSYRYKLNPFAGFDLPILSGDLPRPSREEIFEVIKNKMNESEYTPRVYEKYAYLRKEIFKLMEEKKDE